jgi:hypothetical protein
VNRARVWMSLGLVTAIALCGGLAYYSTALHTSRSAAVAIASGEPPSIEPPADAVIVSAPARSREDENPEWVQLGRPQRDDIDVTLHPGWMEPSTTLVFTFTIRNIHAPNTPAVELGVDEHFTLRGWRVVGYGDAGG